MALTDYKVLLGLASVVLITRGALIAALLPDGPPALSATTRSGTTLETVRIAKVPDNDHMTDQREPLADAAFLSLSSAPGGLLVQPDGKIVVAATLFGFVVDSQSGTLGQFRRGAVRLYPDGSLDRSFYCRMEFHGSDSHRAHLGFQPDGRIFVSGLFDSVDGKPRPGYAMLLPDGRVDESFEPWRGMTNAPPWAFSFPGGTYPAALLPDGSVAVISRAIEGQRAPYPLTVYRLDASGRLMPSAQTHSTLSEFGRPSGLILTLGYVGFWARTPVDWSHETPATERTSGFSAGAPPPVADLPFQRWNEPPTALQAAQVFQALFAEMPWELCRYAVRLPDGGAILAIRNEAVNGSTKARGRFMRFDKNWRPDFTFTNQFEADFRTSLTLKRQKDGRLLVAGLVGNINGEDFLGVVRLEKDGAIDRSFRCQTTGSRPRAVPDRPEWDGAMLKRVMDLAIQPDGRIVICGFFTSVNGVKCQHLARLKPDGSLDETFKNHFLSFEELSAHRRFPVQHLADAPASPSSAAPGTPTPAVPTPETILISSLNYQGGMAVIQFIGNPRRLYLLQARTSLEAASWSSVSTNQTGSSGIGAFRDEDARNYPTRFYRVATP